MIRKTILLFLLLCAPAWLPAENLLTVRKTPRESFNCSVDFAPVLGSDALSLVSVVSVNALDNQDDSTQILAASPSPAIVSNTDIVVFRVKGGTHGETHIINVLVLDSTTGETFEGQITLKIFSVSGH